MRVRASGADLRSLDLLREQVLDHMPVHVCEPALDAVVVE